MQQRKLLIFLEDILAKTTELELSAVLPKALTLAKQLGDKDFEKWLLLEISGYHNTNQALTDDVMVPTYRKVPGQYRNKYGVVLEITDPDLFQIINNYPLREGVAELEQHLKSNSFIVFESPAATQMLREQFDVEVKTFTFNPTSLQPIINEIRNKLIDWLISKQKELAKALEGKNIDLNVPIEISGLHPIVQKTAGALYKDGHYRQAILDTYIALVNEVKSKSGKSDLDNTPLMQQVFSPTNPILRISNDRDEQMGFMWLFSGAVMGIRNPKAHKIVDQHDPQRTLEWLSFASVLLRVLDDSSL